MTEREYFKKLFREAARNLIWFFTGVALCGFISHWLCKCASEDVKVKTDTIVRTDTIRYDSLIPVKESVVRTKKIPVHDTVFVTQTIAVDGDSLVIPITQRVYTDDSTYTAWVSGYDAMLDSIETYRRNTIVTNTITIRKKPSRWSFGINAGYGYGLDSRRLEPYLGVGVSYRFVPP